MIGLGKARPRSAENCCKKRKQRREELYGKRKKVEMKENENEENNDAKVLRIEKRELIQGFVSGNLFQPIFIHSRELKLPHIK